MKKVFLFIISTCFFCSTLLAQEDYYRYEREFAEDEIAQDVHLLGETLFNFDNLSPVMFNLTVGHIFHGTTMGIGMSVFGFYFEWLCNMDIEGGGLTYPFPEHGYWTGDRSKEFNFGYYFPLCEGVDIAPIISYECYQTIAGNGNSYWLDDNLNWHNDYYITSSETHWGLGASVLFYFPISKKADIGSWGLGLTFTSNYWGFNLVVWRMSK